jgi:hypothetical protein
MDMNASGGTKSSRRRFIMGAGVAAGALAVEAIATATAAQAGTDGDVVLGGSNQTNSETSITSSAGIALYADSTDPSGVGVWGDGNGTGLRGAGGDIGVHGEGHNTGVKGHGLEVNGVYGYTDADSASGVYGENLTGTGGYGVAGRSSSPALGAKQGAGVLGENTANGVGVWGHAVNGTGVYADSPSGFALQVNGRASFSRSGTGVVNGTSITPKSSIRISSVALSSRSLVLTTPQKNVGGVWIQAAVPNVAGGYVTIYLNKAVTVSYPVAWFIVEKP